MKIIIDAFQASPAITGSDRMASNLLRELQKLDHDNEYLIVTNAKYQFISDGITAPNFTVRPINATKRTVWLLARLPLLLLRTQADVFYSFYNLAGPGIKVCRTVGSLLDDIPITHPELFFSKASALKRVVVGFSMRHAAESADQFVAISEFTRQSTAKSLGIDLGKITVMLLQADPAFFEPVTAKQLAAVTKKYQLPTGYVFALGAAEPRKNVSGLLVAHRGLPEKLREKFPLLIAGAKWHDRDFDLSDDGHARMLGFIDDADLPSVFRLATVFAFPSKYEGFGLTVLEAMASDTPVITSNTTSIPEVTGEAAILIDPEDIKALEQALERLLTDGALRDKLAKAGAKQVQRFSWEHAAQQLHAILTDSPKRS